MPKHDANSPKAIANRIKSKGLQKLRWYCQMCNKQCRDQNGFKCHLTSESHQRQLLLFGEAPSQYLNEYSQDFEKGYMDIVRRQYGTKRVSANQVYQEYIRNKEHVHMNSTTWYTLTGFVQYLGKTGKCKVDNTEKGWFIQYIDREEEERRAKIEKKTKMDVNDDEKIQQLVRKQAEKAKDQEKLQEYIREEIAKAKGEIIDPNDPAPSTSSSEKYLLKKSEDEVVKLSLFGYAKGDEDRKSHISSASERASIFTANSEEPPAKKKKSSESEGKRKVSALDELKQEEERRKEARNRKDYWLHEGIVVKIMTKRLGDAYYRKKGVIEKVEDNYTGYVHLVNDTSDNLIKLDQAHLETVIPNIGKPVLVVNGAYRGLKATLEGLNEKSFSVSVKITEGPTKGRVVNKIQYEDVCKLDV